MRVVRNTGYLKKRQRASRWMVFLGLLGLAGAMVMTFQPALIIPAYGVLIVGFLVFNAGMQQITKWNRQPRSDQVIDQLLRRVNDRYTLIHYPDIPDWRPEHLLIYPGGVLVLTTRAVQGKVRVEDGKWSRVGNALIRFFGLGGPQLGDPTVECERQQESVQNYLRENGLPGADEVDGLIVFINARAELEIISSDITVVMADELLDTVRDLGTEAALHNQQRKELIAALSSGEDVEGPLSLPSRDPNAKAA